MAFLRQLLPGTLPPAQTLDGKTLHPELAGALQALTRQGVEYAEDDPRYLLFRELLERKAQTESEANFRAQLYRRFDLLYYPTTFTQGGADHWATHETARLDGRVHISLNTPPAYVDIPADLQALPPYINTVPTSPSKADQEAADRREKLFWAWWDENRFDLQLHVISRIRSLYGAVAVKPYWDPDEKVPTFSIIERPENLRIGWGANDFTRKDWALYLYFLSPQAVKEEYGLDTSLLSLGGQNAVVMALGTGTHSDPLNQSGMAFNPRTRSIYEQTQVTVYDYWYKQITPGTPGERSKVQIRNAIYVGNYQVRDDPHPEYDEIPYIYIPNGKIPSQPDGRGELYDIEQIFREKDERLSELGQVMHKSITGQYWQLVGQEAPNDVPPEAKPQPNTVAAPGPGNRIEPITPYLPTMQGEEYLKRLDRELATMTGVSDLLLGLSGSRIVGSSKAINTELSMYVPRIALKREFLYAGLRELWEVTAKLWSRKDSDVAKLLSDDYRLEIRAPEITHRDDQEQMVRAVTAVQNKVWSLRRAQAETGVDNPSEELAQIMSEQTNAALNPNPVMSQMQLLAMANQMGFANTQQAAQAAPNQVDMRGQAVNDLNARRQAAQRSQNPPPSGSQAANGQNAPSADQMPPNAVADNGAPFPPQIRSQTNMTGGETKGRIRTEADFALPQQQGQKP